MIVAEDSALFREGLVHILEDAGIEVAAQVATADELIVAVERDPPDAVIVDVRMPPTGTTEGVEAALELHKSYPEMGILLLSHHVETQYAIELLSDDPSHVGYLLKDRVEEIQEFISSVRRVAAGGSVIDPMVVSRLMGRHRERDPLEALTARERDVLALMAEGRSNQAIAARLFITEKTVQTHVANMFSKLGLLPAIDDHRRILAVLTYLRSLPST